MDLQTPELPGVLARENPFSADAVENLGFRLPNGLTWDALIAKLEASKWIGSIVGPHGSGKTTLLEQLAPRLESRGLRPHLCRLSTESTQADKDALLAAVRELRAPDFLLLDGAEQLSTRQWLPLRVAVDSLAGCVVTLHRTGRLPILYQTETTPALLSDLIYELTGSFAKIFVSVEVSVPRRYVAFS
jgi:predicted AAA+ superfamily ATPase